MYYSFNNFLTIYLTRSLFVKIANVDEKVVDVRLPLLLILIVSLFYSLYRLCYPTFVVDVVMLNKVIWFNILSNLI